MKRNKIEGVKPFDEFWFKDCYHQQIVSVASCFGITPEYILLNSFTFVRDGLILEEVDVFNEKTLFKRLGCYIKKRSVNEKKLVKSIDKGEAIIVGVDTYYLESRPDTYLKQHAAHYITVYGYDLSADIANVVDHNYLNDLMYKEKEISFKNLVYANKMMRKGVLKRRRESCVLGKRKNASGYAGGASWQYIPADKILHSKEASARNLNEIKNLLYDEKRLHDNIKALSNYLSFLKRFYCIVAKAKTFSESEMSQKITRLISAYAVLLSAVWRMDYRQEFSVPDGQKEKLCHIADEIGEIEEKIYSVMAEECV